MVSAMMKNGDFKLTAMWVSNSSGVVSSIVPRAVSPAALTAQSRCPNRSIAAATEARA